MPSEDSKAMKKEAVGDEEDEEECIGAMLKNRKKGNSGDNAVTKSQSAKVKKQPAKVKEEDGAGKPTPGKSSNKASDSKARVKKEEADDDFEEPKSKNTVNKPEKVQKKVKKEQEEQKGKKGTKEAEQNGKKREKKVYDLPGQKRDPPEERDPLRIFYESLYKQVPESDMAAIWMMESGLLSKDKAKQVFEKKQKKSQQQKLGSPMKSVTKVKAKAASSPVSTPAKKTQTPSPAVSTQRKKTAGSEAKPKQSNKRKKDDDDSEAGSDEDFVIAPRNPKKQKAT